MAKIYISSTFKDLEKHREAVYKTLRQCGHDVIAMEDYVSSYKRPLDKCLNDVSVCDVYIGLFAWRYGYIPPGQKKSITELEYDCAQKNNKPCYIFILNEDAMWHPKYIDKNLNNIEGLRKKLSIEHVVTFFTTLDDLKTSISISLKNISYSNPTKEIDLYQSKLKAKYLNLVMEESSIVSLTSINPKSAREKQVCLNLGSIYTALLTESTSDNERHQFKKITTKRLSALEMLNKYKYLAILGDPGSGKSTFVNFIAWCLAGESLQNTYANIDRLTSPMPDDYGNDQDKRQKWEHGPLVPVRIFLRDFGLCTLKKKENSVCAEDLWQYIESILKRATIEEYIPVLKKELTTRGGLVLLDGLDEIPEASNHRVIMKKIIEAFKSAFHRCRILVTSRTYAYQKQHFRIKDFTETKLAPFTSGQIRRFVDMWYSHIGILNHKKELDVNNCAKTLKHSIFNNERIRELSDRPLILTLMCSLHAWRGGILPDKREELYANTTELLLDWWQRETVIKDANDEYQLIQPSLLEWFKTDRDRLREFIEKLAYYAHKGQPEMNGTADILESDLINGIIKVNNNPEVRPLRLIEFLRDRAGLLISRGVGVYTFPHRTFQEYLAACFLTQNDYPYYIAKLAKESPDRWREIVLLAGAKSANGGQFAVWALVDELCFKTPNIYNESPQDIWGSYFAGQILAESASLDNLSERNNQTLKRIKSWLLKIMSGDDLPAIERVNTGNILDKLGDDRFNKDNLYLLDDPLLGFVEIPGGEFIMGSNKKKDKEAEDDESPKHTLKLDTFYISKYPVTVSQYKAYLDGTGKSETDNWYQYNRFGNHPVVMVDWFHAISYCKWLTSQLMDSQDIPQEFQNLLSTEKWQITIPSEAEWEKAARGPFGQIYPWGNSFDNNRLNYIDAKIGRPSTVGCYDKFGSPYHIMEMSGNVWEWTRSIYGKNVFKAEFMYPYQFNDGREKISDINLARVVRGGSWYDMVEDCRAAYRGRHAPGGRNDLFGFRLCLSLSKVE